MSSCCGARIQASLDVGDGPAKLGIRFERVAGDVAKGLCQRLCCELKRRTCLRIGGALSKDFDEQDA